MSRGEAARTYFLKGYNCTQSVVLAFSDRIGLDEETLARLCSPFGGGMGRMREVCGTVTGMYLVLGYLYGYADPKALQKKRELYAQVQQLAEAFRKENGSIICRQLLSGAGVAVSDDPKAEARTVQYYKKRPCADLCAFAVDLLEKYINTLDKEQKDENDNG